MEKNLSAMDPRTLKSEHSLMTEISAQEVSTHFEMSAQEMLKKVSAHIWKKGPNEYPNGHSLLKVSAHFPLVHY